MLQCYLPGQRCFTMAMCQDSTHSLTKGCCSGFSQHFFLEHERFLKLGTHQGTTCRDLSQELASRASSPVLTRVLHRNCSRRDHIFGPCDQSHELSWVWFLGLVAGTNSPTNQPILQCVHTKGQVPATSRCDKSLRLIPQRVPSFKRGDSSLRLIPSPAPPYLSVRVMGACFSSLCVCFLFLHKMKGAWVPPLDSSLMCL